MSDVEIKKNLLKLRAFDPKVYAGLDLDRLVVFALMTLEQEKAPLYFDYIAVGLFKMFPEKFSMANFSQYPDTNRISKALRRLTDQKRKRWATGNIENGFSLTDMGREMGKQVYGFLNDPKAGNRPKLVPISKSRGRSPEDDIREIKESDAFKKWQGDKDINNYEFFAFLKAAPYTPKQLLGEHLKRLKTSATTTKEKEISGFLTWLENKFQNLLQ